MKLSIIHPNANWVIDNIANDYKKFTRHTISNVNDCDALWCLDTFSFNGLSSNKYRSFVSVHHINEDKLKEYNFRELSKANLIIAPNSITEALVKKYIEAPVMRIPYWLLSSYMVTKDNNKIENLKKLIQYDNELLIGSFVKDGNGNCGETPKVSKNPDLFLEIIQRLKNNNIDIKVILSGYARSYVIDKLKSMDVKYVYFERYNDMNTLYDILDWYLVTSRYEGGPQSILEASYREVKILSTDVGIARDVLNSNCICNRAEDFVENIVKNSDFRQYNNAMVKNYLYNKMIPEYDNLFQIWSK